MAERHFDEEKIPTPQRQGMPGKTPGKAEGEDSSDRRSDRPYPNAPNKTPGTSESGEAYDDPGQVRGPVPNPPE